MLTSLRVTEGAWDMYKTILEAARTYDRPSRQYSQGATWHEPHLSRHKDPQASTNPHKKLQLSQISAPLEDPLRTTQQEPRNQHLGFATKRESQCTHLPINLSPLPTNIPTPDYVWLEQATRFPATRQLLDGGATPRGGFRVFVECERFDA
jgi:hypothetical protein